MSKQYLKNGGDTNVNYKTLVCQCEGVTLLVQNELAFPENPLLPFFWGYSLSPLCTQRDRFSLWCLPRTPSALSNAHGDGNGYEGGKAAGTAKQLINCVTCAICLLFGKINMLLVLAVLCTDVKGKMRSSRKVIGLCLGFS